LRNRNVIEIAAGRGTLSGARFIESEFFCQPPDVPVLPETLLRLELNIGGPSISLHEVSQALLSDVGAALKVFRLARAERVVSSGYPSRIEDCVSHLGIDTCIEAISGQVVTRSPRKTAIAGAWNHANSIASVCSLWADMHSETIAPGEAYLVGLFHELGNLPGLLGWDRAAWGTNDSRSMGLRIATQCSLPRCVLEYFSEAKRPGSINRWVEIVEMAHHLTALSIIERGLERSSARAQK